MGKKLLVYLGLMLSPHLWAQDIRVDLHFVSDTTSIGMPVGLRLEIQHPSDMVVIFPHQSKDFLPFERVKIEPEPTFTESNTSIDAATYWIRTFELQDIQEIRLPYGYVIDGDTTWNYTSKDSVQINHRVLDFNGKVELVSQEGILPVDAPPNYFFITLASMGVVGFLALLVWVLRKPFQRQLALRQIRRQYLLLQRKLDRLQAEKDLPTRVEALNSLWKSYLDPKDQLHLRSLTTTELKQRVKDLSYLPESQQAVLLEASQLADKVIYAGQAITIVEVNQLTIQLQPIFKQELERRKDAIK